MATQFSDWLEEWLLTHYLRPAVAKGDEPTRYPTGAITGIVIRLTTDSPGEEGGTGTVVSDGGYSNYTVVADTTFGAPTTPSGNIREISNAVVVGFGTASTGYTATGFQAYDTTQGKVLISKALTAAKVVGAGESCEFAVGELDLQFDGAAWPTARKDEILGIIRSLTEPTRPTSTHLSMYTTGTTKPVGNGYSDVAVTMGTPAQSGSPTVAQVKNTTTANFTATGGNWGSVANFGLEDQANAVICSAGLTGGAVTINDGDQYDWPVDGVVAGLS